MLFTTPSEKYLSEKLSFQLLQNFCFMKFFEKNLRSLDQRKSGFIIATIVLIHFNFILKRFC